jgi:biopolymer transport protein ExbD
MKKILLLLTLLIFTACISDKDPKKEEPKKEEPKKEEPKKESSTLKLNKQQKIVYDALAFYIEQLKSLDADNIITMTYPKLFIAFSENTYKNYIYTMANSSYITIQSFEANITDIGEIQPFSEGNFSQVSYKSVIKIHFTNPDLYNTKLSLNTLYSILARKYEQKNIFVDVETRMITIRKKERMLAIKENENGWKFLGDNPTYRELYPNFLPSDILNQI